MATPCEAEYRGPAGGVRLVERSDPGEAGLPIGVRITEAVAVDDGELHGHLEPLVLQLEAAAGGGQGEGPPFGMLKFVRPRGPGEVVPGDVAAKPEGEDGDEEKEE